MSDVIDLAWIGTTLRTIQAEQRSTRNENQLIRSALSEAITVILQRIGNFEALIEMRMDRLEPRMAATEARFDQLEAGVSTVIVTLNRIEAAIRPGGATP
jgi:hypothetical protein